MSRHVSDAPGRRSAYFQPRAGRWRLDLSCYNRTEGPAEDRPPILMIPGYAMNAFILGYHPTGRSMVGYLVDQGFEVWTANLRGQGEAELRYGDSEFGFRGIATEDMPTVCDVVLDETETGEDEIDVIGCSLGASFVYAYLAHHLGEHRIRSIVPIGGPLRWERVHPAVRLIFSSRRLAGALATRGTRLMARLAIPIVKRLPPIASIYMNVHQIDLENADELVRTVDDPNPKLNREIARWIRNRDLVVAGENVTEAMAEVDARILCIVANHDEIVPEESALSIRDHIGSEDVSTLRVGDEEDWFAHADLFISHDADREVFEPLAEWLAAT